MGLPGEVLATGEGFATSEGFATGEGLATGEGSGFGLAFSLNSKSSRYLREEHNQEQQDGDCNSLTMKEGLLNRNKC